MLQRWKYLVYSFHLSNEYNIKILKKHLNNSINVPYLNLHKYKFKDDVNEAGGYVLLKNKKSVLVMDLGKVPDKKFSKASSSKSTLIGFAVS